MEVQQLAHRLAPMTATRRLLVTIATYNELGNLPRLAEQVLQVLPTADLVVIDDNSPDGTGRWADDEAARNGRVHVIHRAGKLGLGTATIAGLRYAIERDYEFVVNMDADFSHDPRYLDDLIAGLAQESNPRIDVMVGSRYVPGGAITGWPWKRHLMSRAINLFSRIGLGIRCHDCSGAFRAYRVSRLRDFDFETIISRGYSFQEELLWRLQRLGCRIEETPITFADRVQGNSKIDLAEVCRSLAILARLAIFRPN